MSESEAVTANVGFIGAGRMAEALLNGFIRGGVCLPERLLAADPDPERCDTVRKLGVGIAADNAQVADACDVIFLAVKPNVVAKALAEIKEHLGAQKLIVSIAAGISTAFIETTVGADVRVVRVMPNTPCLVGQTAAAIAGGCFATEQDCRTVQRLLEAVGLCLRLEEKLMDTVTGLSGSGPAYVFLVIEALADGGVLMGLGRQDALRLAAQTVLGAAKMVLDGKGHPAALREAVTSPGGTTAEGLRVLETAGVRAAFIDAVKAATLKSKSLGS